jgi:hypothetical protein
MVKEGGHIVCSRFLLSLYVYLLQTEWMQCVVSGRYRLLYEHEYKGQQKEAHENTLHGPTLQVNMTTSLLPHVHISLVGGG